MDGEGVLSIVIFLVMIVIVSIIGYLFAQGVFVIAGEVGKQTHTYVHDTVYVIDTTARGDK